MTTRRVIPNSALFALAAGVAAGSLATGCGGEDAGSDTTTSSTASPPIPGIG